jgi:hypothetical protein
MAKDAHKGQFGRNIGQKKQRQQHHAIFDAAK